jgi:butyryl-CoA dehydrogenase
VRLAVALDGFAYGSKDLGIVNSWGVHSAMVGVAISRWASPQVKKRLVPAMAAGKRIGAFALTEPDAGSDVAAMRTAAREDRNGYVISGRKAFVTNGPEADVFLVLARDENSASRSFSAFLVERKAPGLRVGPPMEKSCIRTSPCCEIEFRECRVAKHHLLGEKGKAFESIVLPALDLDRCIVWAGRLGRLRSILEDATAYAARRVQFGQPIGRHQAVLFSLAEIKVALDTSETVLSAALQQLAGGRPSHQAAATARYVLGLSTMAAADKAMQTFGGYAFDPKNHVERYHRDARLDGIGGGTSEIQRLIIGKDVLASVDPSRPWLSSCVTLGDPLPRHAAAHRTPRGASRPVQLRIAGTRPRARGSGKS